MSFLFGDVCCASAPGGRTPLKRDVMRANIHFILQRTLKGGRERRRGGGAVNESSPNAGIILEAFVSISLMPVKGVAEGG